MKCPYCDNDMRKGGISINRISISWQNEEEFENSPFINPIYRNEFSFISCFWNYL